MTPWSAVIRINGAREHNLKDITWRYPRQEHGYSRGQRLRQVHSCLQRHLRRRTQTPARLSFRRDKETTSHLKQPDVNFIEGLTPVISMKRRSRGVTPGRH
jgi:excinuclease UvrABC ATPase subunit